MRIVALFAFKNCVYVQLSNSGNYFYFNMTDKNGHTVWLSSMLRKFGMLKVVRVTYVVLT